MTDADYYAQSRPEIVALVSPSARHVLDVGCGEGAVGGAIKDAGAEKVVGIEAHESAAQSATQRLDEVEVIDLDDADAVQSFVRARRETFDCVVAADVLEHLRDPWTVIGELVTTIRPAGSMVISIPNVRVLSVLAPLVFRGRFDYRDRGVLDRTHLRFFTRSGAVKMIEDAGLSIVSCSRAPTPWRGPVQNMLGRALGDFGNEQFLFVAVRHRRPSTEPGSAPC